MGPFKCHVTQFFWNLDPHPPPRNAKNIEHYTFVTLFSRKSDPPHPHLRYVTLEWPLYNYFTCTSIYNYKQMSHLISSAYYISFFPVTFSSTKWLPLNLPNRKAAYIAANHAVTQSKSGLHCRKPGHYPIKNRLTSQQTMLSLRRRQK